MTILITLFCLVMYLNWHFNKKIIIYENKYEEKLTTAEAEACQDKIADFYYGFNYSTKRTVFIRKTPRVFPFTYKKDTISDTGIKYFVTK